jgi:uncharacterized coiled-coil protein SlyX
MYSELQAIKDLVGMMVNDKKKINDRLKRKIYKLVNKCMVQELNRGVVGKKQTVDRLEQIIPDLIADNMPLVDSSMPEVRGVIMDDEG